MGLRTGQQCAQQLFILHIRRKSVDFGAAGWALPAHDGPAIWARFDQLRHTWIASSLGTSATFRAGFRTRGDANGTFDRGHAFF